MNILFRLAVVGTLLILIWKFALPKKQVPTPPQPNSDSIRFLLDSLRYDVYVYKTDGVRYQVALERLAEEDSAAAAKFNKILDELE